MALLPTGVLFLYLLPLAIVWGGESLDRQFGLPPIDFGTIKLILGSLLMVVGFFFGIWSV